MRYAYKDNAVGKLSDPLDSGGLLAVLQSGNGANFPTMTTDIPGILTIVKYTIPTDPTSPPEYYEKIKVTGKSTDSLTISERGLGDTSAHDFDAGDYVFLGATEEFFRSIYEEVDNYDGWKQSAYSYVYVSSTSFKVVGQNVTSLYKKGTKIKLTQTTGGTKYFYVKSSSFSTDTTVVLVATSDYSLADEAITGAYFSYDCPPDFPRVLNFSGTPTGYSSLIYFYADYSIEGGVCTLMFQITGVSNSTSFSIPIPIAGGDTITNQNFPIFVRDNGADQSAPGFASIVPNASTLHFYKNYTSTGWTSSGQKYAVGTISYLI